MSAIGRWLVRCLLGAMVVAAVRWDSDGDVLPPPTWLRHRQDLARVDQTFPQRWKNGTRWSVEFELDAGGLSYEIFHLRSVAEYEVVALDGGDRALVQMRRMMAPEDKTRVIWDMPRARLDALPQYYLHAPWWFDDRLWAPVEEHKLPTCWGSFQDWESPIVTRSTALGDVQDVLGDQWFQGVHQRGWIDDSGMLRFELRTGDPSQAILSFTWRPGDPWWAKRECYLPGRTSNPPPLSRKQAGRRWDPFARRDVRARLIAIDGVPVEPLPWEHPPADWMDPSGR